MKIEDLEKALQYFVIAVPESEEQAKAYFWARKAISTLRSMPEAGEPLTLDQLREMDGQPVWIVEYPDWGTGNCQKTQMIISLTETLIFTE